MKILKCCKWSNGWRYESVSDCERKTIKIHEFMNGEQNLNNPQHPACFIPRVNAQLFFHGSLFSGIGGFDLAAEWAGWQNAFHCEWNEFGQKILK
jgi:hypothetical protein